MRKRESARANGRASEREILGRSKLTQTHSVEAYGLDLCRRVINRAIWFVQARTAKGKACLLSQVAPCSFKQKEEFRRALGRRALRMERQALRDSNSSRGSQRRMRALQGVDEGSGESKKGGDTGAAAAAAAARGSSISWQWNDALVPELCAQKWVSGWRSYPALPCLAQHIITSHHITPHPTPPHTHNPTQQRPVPAPSILGPCCVGRSQPPRRG